MEIIFFKKLTLAKPGFIEGFESLRGLGYIVNWWYIIAPPDGTILLRRLQFREADLNGLKL